MALTEKQTERLEELRQKQEEGTELTEAQAKELEKLEAKEAEVEEEATDEAATSAEPTLDPSDPAVVTDHDGKPLYDPTQPEGANQTRPERSDK